MNEVDRGVGFQEVAPGARAIVRLAGDQQHAQPVAHAVHRHRGAVVDQGKLFRPRLDLRLDDILAAAFHGHFHAGGTAYRDGEGLRFAALETEGDRGRALHGIVLDADHELHGLADNAVARGFLDHQPPVAGLAVAGHDMVDRRIDIQRVRAGGRVVHLAVADQDDAGDPVGRRAGQGRVDAVEQHGSVSTFPGLHLDKVKQGIVFRLVAQGFDHGVGGLAATADIHAGRTVGHEHGDIGQRVAFLLHEGGIGQNERDAGNGQRTPDPAGQAHRAAGERGRQGEARQGRDRAPRQERGEVEGGDGGVHWPSLSRISGTWTWSAL